MIGAASIVLGIGFLLEDKYELFGDIFISAGLPAVIQAWSQSSA